MPQASMQHPQPEKLIEQQKSRYSLKKKTQDTHAVAYPSS
jgi:hypothetical protein